MLIFDNKQEFHDEIETITRNRRFEGPKAHRIKWLVEFSYSVDSQKNPMIQLSDLIVLCVRSVRRFSEAENGYRDAWPPIVRNFYAQCYEKINDRVSRKTLVERSGRGNDELNNYLKNIRCEPRRTWRRYYDI